MTGVVTLGPDEIGTTLPPAAAAEAIAAALRSGLDVTGDPPRSVTAVDAGQLLVMPSRSPHSVGVKTITLAPGNAERDLPRIQGVYLHFDAATLELTAILDGVALTNLRTPAVSAAAVTPGLSRFTEPPDVVVYGAGSQAVGHVRALAASLPAIGAVTHVVRRPDRAAIRTGDVLAADDARVRDRLRQAGVVVCATTAREPLFPAADVRAEAVVIAVGSHEPTARELPGELLARAQVVVEDPPTAMREAGDVVLAVEAGHVTISDLIPMADVIRGTVRLDAGRTLVFKSTGMAWEDREIAEAIVRRHSGVSHPPHASH